MYSISIIGWNRSKGINSARTMYYHCWPNEGNIWFDECQISAHKFASPEMAKKWGKMTIKDLVKQYELDGSEMIIRRDRNNILSYIFADMVYDIGSMIIVDDETDLAYGCPIPQEYLLSSAWKE